MAKKIWLNYPAPTGEEKGNEWYGEGWNHAYPIGNGAIGSMVYGDPVHDTLQLNEETIWSGDGGRNRVNPKSKGSYKKVRELLLEGKIGDAIKLLESDMYPEPDNERMYDTAENVWFDFRHDGTGFSNYKRTLDLENAICTVEYASGGKHYTREFFVSAPDHVIAVHQSSSDGGKTSCKIDFSRRSDKTYKYELGENGLFIYAKEPENGCKYCVAASCENEGGVVVFSEKGLEVFDADSFTLYITIRSDFYHEDIEKWCSDALDNAVNIGYDGVRSRHVADYKSYFDRMSLNLDGEDYDDIPTNERMRRCKDVTDTKLAENLFDFGRYLLISSSRPGNKPANLQGIWNKDAFPAWGSKYTININAEMNYWPSEICGLSDCHLPLLEHIKVMLPYGQKVAKDMYGLDGFVAHHNTDIFGDCAPQDKCITATIWPMGAAWLCTHIWVHYLYTLDKEFLRNYLGVMKQACLFLTQYMFEYNGQLLTGPSISPENSYIHPSGERGQICVGPTMDSMIATDLFNACINASKILGECDELTDKLEEMLPKIPKPSIGKYGQIMEWFEDYEEVEQGHRHISHLYGLFPSSQITYEKTPELMKAARVTLERRLSGGGGHTGWSRAWIICMWARLRDGEKAWENVVALLDHSTYNNFLDRHPPFQIDGNFGAAAGMAQMLLQSQESVIVLLPAIPAEWKSGSVKGLKARGDVTVGISWKDGKLTYAKLRANQGGKISLSMPKGYGCGTGEIKEFESDKPYTVVLENGEVKVCD